MGLLDMFGGASNPGALYGGLLTPEQNSALAYRGLLAAAGALGQAAMPSRMPIPIGAALGSAAGAMGSAQDEAALNAMRGGLLGLQERELNLKYDMQRNALAQNAAIQQQMFGGGASPAGGGEVSSLAPNADLSGVNPPIGNGTGGGENWETRHNNFAGMRIPGIIAGPNSGGFQSFDTPEAGVAAISHQLDRYASGATTGKPLTTLRGIISTWAPPSENDTTALIGRATKIMGVDADTPLDLFNPDTKAKLVEAMIRNEQGGNLPAAAAAAIPTVFNAPSFTPYGGKPKQVAAAPGPATDVVPQPPAPPQGLLPPQAPGSDTLRVGGAGGLLALPQPTATPSTNAPPINGVGAPAPGPQGGMLALQAPQVAQAPMAPPAPPQASINGLDPYTRRMLGLEAMNANLGIAGLGTPYQGMVGVLAGAPGYKGAQAGAEAEAQNASKLRYAGPTATATKNAENASDLFYKPQIAGQTKLAEMPFTAARPNSSFPQVGPGGQVTGWTQAPAAPERITQFDPATGMGYPGSFTPQSPFGKGVSNLGGGAPNGPQPGANSPFQGQVPTTLGKGIETSLEGRAKAEQESRQQTIDAGTAASKQQATLLSMKAAAPNFYTGPFSEHVNDARTILMMLPGGDKYADSVSNYNDFAKNAGFLTRQAVHDTSPRAAVQEFRLIGGALPNVDIPEKGGLIRVLNEYMGLNDYNIAKAQAQQMWENQNGGPGRVTGFETDWQAKVSPYAFIMMRMDPTDRQKLFAQVGSTKAGQAELQHLGQQMQYIQQSGLERFIQ